jgi:hypothetical protein
MEKHVVSEVSDAYRLPGKTVIIARAASAVGRKAAELFADIGAKVIIAEGACRN